MKPFENRGQNLTTLPRLRVVSTSRRGPSAAFGPGEHGASRFKSGPVRRKGRLRSPFCFSSDGTMRAPALFDSQARLILAPQPERALAPPPSPSLVRGFFVSSQFRLNVGFLIGFLPVV
jgi:hypothetical protein